MNRHSGGIFGRSPSHSLHRLVEWGEHFKVDQAQIDAQHEAIFKLAMEIAQGWQQRDKLDLLKQQAAKLEKLLAIHFRYEEQQLAEVGYPRLDEHATEHRVMLEELRLIRARLEDMPAGSNPIASGFIVNNFVLGLTVGHITHSDMEYCAFARKKFLEQASA